MTIEELVVKLKTASQPFLKYGISIKAEIFDTGEILIRREIGMVPEDELIKLNQTMIQLENQLNQ